MSTVTRTRYGNPKSRFFWSRKWPSHLFAFGCSPRKVFIGFHILSQFMQSSSVNNIESKTPTKLSEGYQNEICVATFTLHWEPTYPLLQTFTQSLLAIGEATERNPKWCTILSNIDVFELNKLRHKPYKAFSRLPNEICIPFTVHWGPTYPLLQQFLILTFPTEQIRTQTRQSFWRLPIEIYLPVLHCTSKRTQVDTFMLKNTQDTNPTKLLKVAATGRRPKKP